MKIVFNLPEECLPEKRGFVNIDFYFIDKVLQKVDGHYFTVLPDNCGDLIDVNRTIEDIQTVSSEYKDKIDWSCNVLKAQPIVFSENNMKNQL